MKRRAARYRVEARRGSAGVLEAVHHVTVVAWDAELEELARRRAPEELVPLGGLRTQFRSGCKPLQLVPLVERGHADRLGLGTAELAVASASHDGSGRHLEAVRSILRACGVAEQNLLCGHHRPRDEESLIELLRSGGEPSPIYNNCSGKHAAMLALAVAEGWPIEDYVAFDHPVQRACVAAVCSICGVDPSAAPIAVDGCSAANPALSLVAMARGFARLASAESDAPESRERALARIRQAMAAEPFLVAGAGRLCTDLMTCTAGAVLAKGGAEGLHCAAIPAAGAGVALKVEDGSERARGPALLAFLGENGWISDEERHALRGFEHPTLTNVRGAAVGRLEWKAEPVSTFA